MSASATPEMSSSTSVEFAGNRPRRSARITVLLSVLTLVNAGGLVLATYLLAEAGRHSRDGETGLLAFSVVVAVVGLVGLGGAWSLRKWGPRVYLAAIVVDRIVALIALPDVTTVPVLLGGLLLAGILVAHSEREW